MTLEKKVIKEYNLQRPIKSRRLLCHAPFSSINFTQSGEMRACCYNKTEILGTYPQQSIKQAWEGEQAKELRAYMKSTKLASGCQGCQEQISSGNYAGTKAVYYDEYATIRSLFPIMLDPPKVFEFEISNTCNLECIMCNGYFSSAIRANREKLPKLHSPYDNAFIEQVKKYLPHLTDAKFLGGEPFLISQYYEIWESIISINPKIKVHITTNGTVLNKRAKECLEKMKAGIIVSVDSLDKENYEKIRVNGDFEMLMENIRWFIDYRNRKGIFLSFAVCPMVSNIAYLKDIVQFCNTNDIYIHFNTVWEPVEECMRSAKKEELQKLVYELSEVSFENHSVQKVNKARVNDFLAHINSWIQEQADEIKTIKYFLSIFKKYNSEGSLSDVQTILDPIIYHYNTLLEKENLQIERNEFLGAKLEKVADSIGHDRFRIAFAECLLIMAKDLFSKNEYEDIKHKIHDLMSMTENMDFQTLNRTMLQRNFDFIGMLNNLKNMTAKDVNNVQKKIHTN